MKQLAAAVSTLATLMLTAPAFGQLITIKTTEELGPLNQKLAEAYQGKHPGIHIDVSAGPVKESLDSLAQKKSALLSLPRALKYKEGQACETALGKRPADFKIGVNGVGVYVPSANPVPALTYAELESIFKGKYRNWKDVGGNDAPIVLFCVATNSSAGDLFKTEVLSGTDWATEAHVVTEAELLPAVAKDPNAIGFRAVAEADGVRAVPIKRAPSSTPVLPNEETISNRIYPLSRYLYNYLSPASDNEQTRAFLNWVRSDDGQKIVKEAGYYPIPPKLRSGQ